MKSMISRLTVTGSRAWGRCPAPPQDHELGVRQLGQPTAPGRRLAAVLVAVDDEHRTAHPGTQLLGLVADRKVVFSLVAGDHRLRLGAEGPADGVVELLRRVRLGQQLVEEEVDPAAIAARASPELVVVHGPAGRRVERVG